MANIHIYEIPEDLLNNYSVYQSRIFGGTIAFEVGTIDAITYLADRDETATMCVAPLNVSPIPNYYAHPPLYSGELEDLVLLWKGRFQAEKDSNQVILVTPKYRSQLENTLRNQKLDYNFQGVLNRSPLMSMIYPPKEIRYTQEKGITVINPI